MENWSGGPFCRSTITVSLNNLVPMHRDVNNDENYKNHVVGLGNFQHGGLWIQEPGAGDVASGPLHARQLPNGEWTQGPATYSTTCSVGTLGGAAGEHADEVERGT